MDRHEQFFQLWLRHEADLKAFLGSLVRDPHARDDVFQEVASTLWKRFEQYDPQQSFGGWARGIAARKVLEHARQNARFPVVFAPRAIQAIAEAFDRTEATASRRYDALRLCLAQLPERSRRLLVLRYDQELEVEAIASQTERTLDAVYQALSRVRGRLEQCIRRRLALEERKGR